MKLCLVSGDTRANKRLEEGRFQRKRCCLDMQTDARRERYIERAFGVCTSEQKTERHEKRTETLRPPVSMLEKILSKTFAIVS